MQSRLLEIAVGLFLCLGVGAIFILTTRVASLQPNGNETYDITASFENLGGLKVGSAITMAGINIGRVSKITLNPETFEADVTLSLQRKHDALPRDSSASILTAGLLGEKYIGLEPGGDPKPLKAGDSLKITESALVLEQVISQFLFSQAESGGKE